MSLVVQAMLAGGAAAGYGRTRGKTQGTPCWYGSMGKPANLGQLIDYHDWLDQLDATASRGGAKESPRSP